MAANVVLNAVALGDAAYEALAAEQLIMNATLGAAATNVDPVNVKIGTGAAKAWPAGFQAFLEAADLSQISVQGTTGDSFFVVAYSR